MEVAAEMTQALSDAEVYARIHDLITAEPVGEKRRAPRAEYRCTQFVAPLLPSGQPDLAASRNVTCHDLSNSGISFVDTQQPTGGQFVVGLGREGELIMMIAEVMRSTLLDEGPPSRFRIGCRFVGRYRG